MTFRLFGSSRVGVFSPSSREPELLDEESAVPGRGLVFFGIRGDVRGASASGVEGTDLSALRIPNHPVRDSARGALYSAAIWKKKLPSRN
jgi:hypothetical protein